MADRATDPVRAFRGADEPASRVVPGMALGSVLSLVGGLALIAAFFMPWFGVQQLLLSGSFLGRFLGNPADLARFMPAMAASPGEAQALRALVYFFPSCGVVAASLALGHGLWPRPPRWLTLALILSGLVPLVALAVGVTRLPPGAGLDVGIWLMGLGATGVVLGPPLNRLLTR